MTSPTLAVTRQSSIDAGLLGAVLRSDLRRGDVEAALFVAPIVGEAIALGAFQHVASAIDRARTTLPITRRSTGGPAITVGEGQIFVALELSRAGLFEGTADPSRALNRHVRPLLRAITASVGVVAMYGGRDFVAIRGVPIAWCGARHSRVDGVVGLEMILGVQRTFALDPALDLAEGAIAPRWLGRSPIALNDVRRRALSRDAIADAIVAAYGALADDRVVARDLHALADAPDPRIDEAPFDAMTEIPIGLLGAARDAHGATSLGGDWMVSDDARAALEADLAILSHAGDDVAIGAIVDRHLGAGSGTMLLGVTRLDAVAKVIAAARQK